jgi:NADPH-dependent 2,4-dienoyl-CoA reductase/sulfur reductase-like enzyme
MSVLDIRAAITDGAKLGKRVVVAMAEVDRGEQALAVAEFLVDRGHQVTVVSPALEPSINQEFFTSEQAYRRLLPKKVRFLAVTEVTGVRPGEVDTMNVYTLRPGTVPADSVVVSHGGVANDSLIDQLQLRRPNVFSAGDCIAPRDIAGAISDGMRVMEKLVAVARQ